MVIKDVKKEKEEKKEKEVKEEKKVTWFQKVPAIWKIGGIAVLFVRYQSIAKAGEGLQELWVWAGIVMAIWYFIGSEGQKRESVILTPEEAEEAVEKEIKRKIKKGQISIWAEWHIGPNNGWFVYEGMPKHYLIGVKIIEDNIPQFKKATVVAEGDAKGYCTIGGHPGEMQGTEITPIKTPAIFKTLKKYDIDYKDFIFGEKK